MTEANIITEDIQNTPQVIKLVHISGQLDESNIDEKIQIIYKLIETTPKGLNLILDLENLEYLNSKSIGYLTDIYGKLIETDGQIVIVKLRPNIADILQVVGLTQLIKVFNSIDEAKNAVSKIAPQAPAAQPAVAASTPASPSSSPTPASSSPTPASSSPTPPSPSPAPPATPAASIPPSPVVAPAAPGNPALSSPSSPSTPDSSTFKLP